MEKFFFIWKELKSSFWFIPILIIIGTVGVAIGLLYLDNRVDFEPEGLIQFVFTGSADSARSVLATISGAMIGVAGTVFSITLVALTLASSQFGPRLLRNFMHERINQVVLGSYISTYVYCLIVLNTVKDTDQLSFIPVISVLAAIVAAVANIILLIIFIHHIAISIQADKVIADISAALSKTLNRLYPEQMGDSSERAATPDIEVRKSHFNHMQPMLAAESGYLQYVDEQGVMKKATEADMLIELKYRPGDYLVRDMEIGSIYSNDTSGEEDSGWHREFFIIGNARTPQQDAEFSIHQMVEIAARALSPGINDPYTAIACIDNLTSTLCTLTRVKFPSRYRFDEEENLRVIAEPLNFTGMIDAAFNQIRQFSGGSPAVPIRLMEALVTIDKFTRTEEQKKAIRKHAKMLLRMAERAFEEKNDLEDLKKRSRGILG